MDANRITSRLSIQVSCEMCGAVRFCKKSAVPKSGKCRICHVKEATRVRFQSHIGNPLEVKNIDLATTQKQYGYDASKLADASGKPVLAICTECKQIKTTRRCLVGESYRCKVCALKDPCTKRKKRDAMLNHYAKKKVGESVLSQTDKAVLQATKKTGLTETTCIDCGSVRILYPSKIPSSGRCKRCALIHYQHTKAFSYNTSGNGLDQIDREATLNAFGYDPSTLHTGAGKNVIAICKICSTRKQTRRCLVDDGYSCRSCRLKAPGLQQRRFKTLKNSFPLGAGDPAITAKKIATLIKNYSDGTRIFVKKEYGAACKQIYDLVIAQGIQAKQEFVLRSGKRLDIIVPGKNVAIEYNGLRWHHEESPEPRKKHYHADKWREAESQGLRLITIFEDEWLTRRYQVEGILKAALDAGRTKLMARKCNIASISKDLCREFMDAEHLQGATTRSLACWGLFYENELVAAISLAKHHRNTEGPLLVLDRMCFKHGVNVVGGATKLLKPLLEEARRLGATKVVSWSDNRWSQGKVYEAMGFTKEEVLGPDYAYVSKKYPRERISKQSQKKSNSGCPEGLTELEWATQNGLARIWDCGKTRWAIYL